jgi:replicative DNA helicase
LPCDLDAEKKVLGAMIRDPDAIPRARDILAPSDFYQPSHQILYETMLEIDRSGWPVDLLILANALTRKNLMNEAGGPFYLAELVGCVATSVNVEYHARLVLDKAVRRRIIRQCAEISAAARTEELETVAEQAYQFAIQAQPPAVTNHIATMEEGLLAVSTEFQTRWERKKAGKSLKEISTGFSGLDHITGGIGQGELWILAGRPAEGKSLLAAQIGMHAAREGNVLFFSLEMSQREILERTMNISYERDHDVTARRIQEKSNELRNLNFYTVDLSDLDITQIAAKAETFKAKHKGLSLIILDYLQLVAAPDHLQRAGLVQQVTFTSNQCKMLARRLGCGFLVLSQLSRASEKEGRRPRLSDLRESGAIEQDADLVMFIHREGEEKGQEGPRLLMVEKNRHGRCGHVELYFKTDDLRFRETDHCDEPAYVSKAYPPDDEVPF